MQYKLHAGDDHVVVDDDDNDGGDYFRSFFTIS